MAKRTSPTGNRNAPPKEYAQIPPRDLYPTSDIRFVIMEVGQLTAKVDRLISDVKSQGVKLDKIRHQATFIKGGIAVGGALIAAFIWIAASILNTKWDAVMEALRALSK